MSFLEELKRRNVFRVGIAYGLLGWVVLQAADFALDLIDAPNWVIQVFFIAGLVGLPFALFFAWAYELTPEGIKREEDVDRSGSITPTTGRKLDRAIIGFLALAVVLLLADRFINTGDRGAETRSAETQVAAEQTADADAPPPKSVAVLPFADLSQNGDQEWFADGLAEEILSALARTPDLLVASRTSSFAYKGLNKDILEIAEDLGVAHVLEGSVRSAGGRIRVTAQLIRAEDGFHVWSEDYDRAPDDLIGIQEDLALSIAEALETTMDPDELEAMARVGTRSVEAYKAYLRGLANDTGSADAGAPTVREALRHYEEATDIDPRFAQAYLRQAFWWKGQLTPSFILSGATDLTVEELMERFTAAIDQAIEHAATDIDRRGYLAQKAEVEVRIRDAIEFYEAYLEARPNDLPALLGLAGVVEMIGDAAARQRTMPRLRERGLRDTTAATWYLSTAYDDGDPDEVADYGLERLRDHPDHRGLLYQTHRALMWAGRAEEGASVLRRYNLNFDESPLMLMRQACIEGRREDAEQAFAAISRGNDDRWRTTAWLGLKILGRDAEADPLLEPIARSTSPYQIATMLNYAIFDPGPHPELMNILEREGVLRPAPKALPFRCAPSERPSVAVLAFDNMSPDPANEFFAEGISEEILNVLAELDDLRVIARTSAFSFKGSGATVAEIADKLDVGYVVEGSVRRAGDRVRVMAQLIDTGSESRVWSETYDRNLDDIFAVQDEIARAIAGELELKLTPEQETQLVRATTESIEAYNQYLLGRQLWHSRNIHNLRASAEALNLAITLDPNFAEAWAALADALVLIPEYDPNFSMDTIPAARDAVNRALELKPDLPQALVTRAYLRAMHDFDWDNAERDFLRALELDPEYPTAHQWYGEYLGVRYRDVDGALAQFRKASELDPLAPIMWHVSGWTTVSTGRPEEAITYFKRALDLNPNMQHTYTNLGLAYALLGRYDLAREAVAGRFEVLGVEQPEGVTWIDALQDPSRRAAFLDDLEDREDIADGALGKAMFYALLDDLERAMDNLETALEQGEPYASHANRLSFYEPLRDDPRFQAHLAKMNLWPPTDRR
jgi:TolB-like protein/Flp pilus assembly protein TadD